MRLVFVAATMVFGTLIVGCSSQQAYGAGQAWQRNECYKIDDGAERSRCLASASTSYEAYQRQAAAAKGTP